MLFTCEQLKREAAEEQEQFNKRHGLYPKKWSRKKSMCVEEPGADMHLDEDAPIPKKRKISEPNKSIDDEPPRKQVTVRRKAQFKLPKKTPSKSKKQKVPERTPSDEEHNDVNDVKEFDAASDTNNEPDGNLKMEKRSESQSETSDVNDRIESETASSSTGVNGAKKKKRSKNHAKAQNVEPPGEKPPPSLFDYFAKHIHTGKPRKAQKAFDKLTKQERKRMSIDYNEMVEVYVGQLKNYLASMSQKDTVAYVSMLRLEN